VVFPGVADSSQFRSVMEEERTFGGVPLFVKRGGLLTIAIGA